MTRIAVVLTALLAFGCGPGMLFHRPSPEEQAEANKTPDQRFTDRWAGRSEDDLLLRYGKPTDVVQLSSGNHVNSYHRELYSSSSRSAGYVGPYGGSSGASSEAGTIYCDRRFEVDKATFKVVRASISGNRCDFNQ